MYKMIGSDYYLLEREYNRKGKVTFFIVWEPDQLTAYVIAPLFPTCCPDE